MAHYLIELPNGKTIGMNDEMGKLYKEGKWDPTREPDLTPEEEASLDECLAEMRRDIFGK